jgi:hypothetical protein
MFRSVHDANSWRDLPGFGATGPDTVSRDAPAPQVELGCDERVRQADEAERAAEAAREAQALDAELAAEADGPEAEA